VVPVINVVTTFQHSSIYFNLHWKSKYRWRNPTVPINLKALDEQLRVQFKFHGIICFSQNCKWLLSVRFLYTPCQLQNLFWIKLDYIFVSISAREIRTQYLWVSTPSLRPLSMDIFLETWDFWIGLNQTTGNDFPLELFFDKIVDAEENLGRLCWFKLP
jgi:hypothetical protein